MNDVFAVQILNAEAELDEDFPDKIFDEAFSLLLFNARV